MRAKAIRKPKSACKPTQCIHCSKPITQNSTGPVRRFCSSRCTLRHRRGCAPLRTTKTVACRRCGAVVSFVLGDVNKGRPKSTFCTRRCRQRWDKALFRKRHPRPRAAIEPMVRIRGTFLYEDMAQERILAELEGRAFDRTEFLRKHAPWRERTKLSRAHE